MSRAKIGGVAALIVVALTAAAYTLSSSRLEASIRKDVEGRVSRAQDLLARISVVESLQIVNHAKGFALEPELAKAFDEPNAAAKGPLGTSAIQHFLGTFAPKEIKPDFVAVVDAKGAVMASDSPLPDQDGWRRFKSVAAALDTGQTSKDIWSYGKGTVKVGVAPVHDASGAVRGAVVLAYAINSSEAQQSAALLGTEVVFFSGETIVATSFRRAGDAEDIGRQAAVKELEQGALAGKHGVVAVAIGGDTYLASAGAIPMNFDDKTSGAIVLQSLGVAMEPVSTVRITILLLGAGALLLALLVMMATARLILHPAEEIELGVHDIINGNVDYVFKPAGADLDGLANSLNVMLARLLGRPEPGEDDLDEDSAAGNGKVVLDDEGVQPQAAAGGVKVSQDPDVVALAHEPEADYYKRIFGEYLEARKALGENVEGVTYEGFVAKLRLNEANLRKRYACKAVRFRVQSKNGQVMLKPVPIV